jgi:hypothetical protein
MKLLKSHRSISGEEVGKPYCQEAPGVGREDVGGCPLSRFGGAANCCRSADEDVCGN